MDSFNNVDEYISSFSEDTQVKLEEMRNLIKKVHPDAVETISYGIPTYKINNKTIVHFGGAKKHIGLYPGAAIVALFKDQLDQYEISKGTIRLPLDKPLPESLIKEIVIKCKEINL